MDTPQQTTEPNSLQSQSTSTKPLTPSVGVGSQKLNGASNQVNNILFIKYICTRTVCKRFLETICN